MDYAAKIAMSTGALLAFFGFVSLTTSLFIPDYAGHASTIGDMNIPTAQTTPQIIPQEMSWGMLALGMVLISGGIYRRR